MRLCAKGQFFMNNGRLIVLEGLDGCGKSTQLSLLAEHFAQRGTYFRSVSFPNYDSHSGRIISDYLAGNIPCDGRNGAYAASTFYAADRYISYTTDWRDDYEKGAAIVCGRYTTSNAIYQMTKLPAEEREGFLAWLAEYEYGLLGLPRPDAVLFLDMPAEVSEGLLSVRYGGEEQKKDIHERSTQFQRSCRESALFAAQRCGWQVIPCAENGAALPIEEIHARILAALGEGSCDV